MYGPLNGCFGLRFQPVDAKCKWAGRNQPFRVAAYLRLFWQRGKISEALRAFDCRPTDVGLGMTFGRFADRLVLALFATQYVTGPAPVATSKIL